MPLTCIGLGVFVPSRTKPPPVIGGALGGKSPQPVDTSACGDNDQPRFRGANLEIVRLQPPQEHVPHDVLGFAHGAEHPIRHVRYSSRCRSKMVAGSKSCLWVRSMTRGRSRQAICDSSRRNIDPASFRIGVTSPLLIRLSFSSGPRGLESNRRSE